MSCSRGSTSSSEARAHARAHLRWSPGSGAFGFHDLELGDVSDVACPKAPINVRRTMDCSTIPSSSWPRPCVRKIWVLPRRATDSTYGRSRSISEECADPLAASATGQPAPQGGPCPPAACPTSARSRSTSRSRPPPRPGTTCSPARRLPTPSMPWPATTILKGLGGKDTLNGGDGSDLLDGGTGNDKLNGGGGVDLVTYTGSAKVVFDLSGTPDTAKRGSETDTLTGIEGAIGSSAADVFKGNEFNNYFQGANGKDTFTGGSGSDLYDFNAVAESGVGTTLRDVVTDFVHLGDDIDLAGIDANTVIAGNQAFRGSTRPP